MQLSGPVAVLSEDGQSVIQTRDLGDVPVGVKAGRVLPLVEVRPELTEGQLLGAYTDVIGAAQVVRTWSIAPLEMADFQRAIEERTEAVARERGYASTVACATYDKTPTPLWQAEGEAFVAWRDAVWVYAFAQLALVQAGQRAVPTIAELIAELPVIEWPQ